VNIPSIRETESYEDKTGALTDNKENGWIKSTDEVDSETGIIENPQGGKEKEQDLEADETGEISADAA
jgi:hypothetical protein